MKCPSEWFFMMEWITLHPEEYKGAEGMRQFRAGLTPAQVASVRQFLLAASVASNADLRQLECPEISNSFALVPKGELPLREIFKSWLGDFDSEVPGSLPGAN